MSANIIDTLKTADRVDYFYGHYHQKGKYVRYPGEVSIPTRMMAQRPEYSDDDCPCQIDGGSPCNTCRESLDLGRSDNITQCMERIPDTLTVLDPEKLLPDKRNLERITRLVEGTWTPYDNDHLLLTSSTDIGIVLLRRLPDNQEEYSWYVKPHCQCESISRILVIIIED